MYLHKCFFCASFDFPSYLGFIKKKKKKRQSIHKKRQSILGSSQFTYLNGLVVFPTLFNLSLNLAIRSS